MLRPLLSLTLELPGWTVAQNNVDAIIQRSVEANQRDWDTAPQFDYFERVPETMLDISIAVPEPSIANEEIIFYRNCSPLLIQDEPIKA
jgi:hypothetical protein